MRICVFVLLGAIVNVAVAWTRVVVKGSVSYSTRYYHDPKWIDGTVIAIHHSRGYNVVWPVDRSGTMLRESPRWVHEFNGRAWWKDAALIPNMNNYAIACGWPVFSLTSWRTVQDGDEMRFPGVIHHGIVWQSPSPAHMRNTVEWVPPILALKPLWPGFAINTVLYAAILWVLFAAPFALRRRLRIKRGLCPACGYDLRGRGRAPGNSTDLCPECGKPVTEPRREINVSILR